MMCSAQHLRLEMLKIGSLGGLAEIDTTLHPAEEDGRPKTARGLW